MVIDADDTIVGAPYRLVRRFTTRTPRPNGKALLFEIFPSVNDDYIQMEMSQVDLNGCPGSFLSCEARYMSRPRARNRA